MAEALLHAGAVSAPAGEALRALALELYEVDEALQGAIDATRELLGAGVDCPLPPLSVSTEEILDYARFVARTSHAPFGWPNNTPAVEERRHAGALYACLQPPVPTEQQFQASILHAQPPLPAHAAPADAAAAAAAAAVAGAPPGAPPAAPADVAALLRSWRPGEPLPKGLPPMPPGWKPGDPLPFALGRPGAGGGADVAPAEDTRYVPRVALEELNPDLVDFEVVGDGAYDDEDEDEEDDSDDE